MVRSTSGEPSRDGYSLLLETAFDVMNVASVRHQIIDAASGCRLGADALDNFVFAVNEVMTNAVRHGGGTGQLRLWLAGELRCQVVDQGPGFDPLPYLDHQPQPSAQGGMGLWLARQTSDTLTITSGSPGTTVDIRTFLPPASPA